MWTYVQKSGWLISSSSARIAQGYSGHGPGKNNPAMQNVKAVGPLPCGVYDVGAPIDTAAHGPFVLPLTPDPANEMFGRGSFLVHGDSIPHPGEASLGCCIQPRFAREALSASGERLQVISGEDDAQAG